VTRLVVDEASRAGRRAIPAIELPQLARLLKRGAMDALPLLHSAKVVVQPVEADADAGHKRGQSFNAGTGHDNTSLN